MNLRTLSLVVAVLVAACAAAYFIQRPPPPAPPDARVDQPVLDPALAARAAQLRVADAGKTVTLRKQADGTWRVADYFDLPADFAKLSRLIGELADAKIQRLVTVRPDRLARMEFKATAATLLDDAGRELWQVTLGKTAEGGGRYLRYGTEEKAYQASLNAWLDPEAKNWADAALLNLKADDIARVEIGFTDAAAPTVKVARAKPGDPWTATDAPAGKKLKADRVASLLSSLGTLRFTETVASDDAAVAQARAHQRTVKLTTFKEVTYTVALGRLPEAKKLKPATAMPPPADASTAPAGPETPIGNAAPPGPPAPPAAPEFETIPAGPVFVSVVSSEPGASINATMKQRAFQTGEWTFTGLPAAPADLWEEAAAPAAAAPAPAAPAAGPTPDRAPPKP